MKTELKNNTNANIQKLNRVYQRYSRFQDVFKKRTKFKVSKVRK